MPQPLQVLIVEDNPHDAALIIAELKRAGYAPDWQRVETEEAYLTVLNSASPPALDIIFSDYRLSGFDGISALKLLLAGGQDIPFIFVSGTMGKDIAVQALKLGAADYLLKNRMARLGHSTTQAMQVKALRDEQKRAQTAMQRRQTLEKLINFISMCFLGIPTTQLEQTVLRVLREVGEFAHADYSGLRHMLPDLTILNHEYEWHAVELSPFFSLAEYPRDFIWVRNKLLNNEVFYASCRDDLPAEATAERAAWLSQGLSSVLTIPLLPVPGAVRLGSFTLATIRTRFDWDAEDLALFKMLGDIFANAIVRAQSEEHLWREHNLLRTVIDQMPDAIYAKDRAGQFILGNTALSEQTGSAQNEILGRTDFDFFPKEDALQYQADDQSVINSGRVIFGRTELVQRRDSEARWYTTTKAPLRDEQGQIIGLVGIGRDITQAKLADDALRESEDRFKLLYKQAPLGYQSLDKDGNFLDVNQAWLDALGYNREEVIGKWFGDFVVPSQVALFEQRYPMLKATGAAYAAEYEMTHRDGSTVLMSFDAREAHDANGQFIQSHAILTDITERRRVENTIREQLATITALYDSAKWLFTSLDLQILIAEATRICVETFSASMACIVRAEADGGVDLMSQFPPDIDYPSKVDVRWDDTPDGGGPAGTAIRTGASVVTKDLLTALAGTTHQRYALNAGFTSAAAFPLPGHSRTYGALVVYFDNPDALTPGRSQFFESYALQLAAALENALLFEQTTRRLQQVQSLNAIDVAMTHNQERDTVLDVILEEVTRQLDVDAATVLLLDAKTRILTCVAAHGFRAGELKGTRVDLGRGFAGQVAQSQRMVTATASLGEKNSFIHFPLAASEGFQAYYGVPLIANGQLLGVLEVLHRTPLNRNAEWLDFLQILATQSAVALRASAMFNDLEHMNTELTEAYDATIEGWSRALDMRDSETQGHASRVTTLTMQLARNMGMSEADLGYLRWGALLHDIGKINVPDSILLKPGPLTQEEWAVMRRHPLNAYNMLLPIRYLRPILDVPYCHHERWDGAGYPRGLKGLEIPVGARIIAVVDVWDALLSERPYRAAWTVERAQKYVLEQSGTQFDPEVVEVFLRMIAKNNATSH